MVKGNPSALGRLGIREDCAAIVEALTLQAYKRPQSEGDKGIIDYHPLTSGTGNSKSHVMLEFGARSSSLDRCAREYPVKRAVRKEHTALTLANLK